MENKQSFKVKTLDDYSPVLLVKDVMEILRISKPVAYKLLQEGKLKSCKVGREYKIAKCHLIEFLNTNFLEVNSDR